MYSSKDQWFEAWDDYYAKQHDTRERYHCQIRDMMDMSQVERQYRQHLARAWQAGHGHDLDSYEAYWKRLFKYYENI
jgi:hypothetical protein